MYIVLKDNKIVLADTEKKRIENAMLDNQDLLGCQIEETLRPIEQMDGAYVYADTTEYVQWKNEQIKQYRASLYAEQVDPLHAEKQRKTVLETWTEADEVEYVEQVKSLTAKIQEENPYIESSVDKQIISD